MTRFWSCGDLSPIDAGDVSESHVGEDSKLPKTNRIAEEDPQIGRVEMCPHIPEL